jgi:hypothetical protein
VQAATDFSFSFDFDEWSRLAKVDPSAFEARRLALIEEFLRQFPQPDQQRLRGLQFRIDMVRRRARTPMGACLKISSMMWESLLGSHGLKTATTLCRPHSCPTARPCPPASFPSENLHTNKSLCTLPGQAAPFVRADLSKSCRSRAPHAHPTR